LEAAFSKQVLHLSNSRYGLLVSIAGIGFLAGSISNTALVKKIPLSILIGISPMLISMGYFIYSLSGSFLAAACGFFVLSFFQAYANTGILTFYQHYLPAEIMGRAGSILDLVEGGLVMAVTLIIGTSAQWFSLRPVILGGSFVMILAALILSTACLKPSKQWFFLDSNTKEYRS
jgi:hypothetical protein